MNSSNCIELLWKEGFFIDGRTLGETTARIKEKWNNNFSPVDLSKALVRATFLRRMGKRGQYKYIQKVSYSGKKLAAVEDELFSKEFVEKVEKVIKNELDDLHLNFGHSGTCTAFLLRKILEKLTYLVFAKNGLSSKIEDKNSPSKLVGLEKMLDTASQEKLNGIPILGHKTAREIKGIKFLGDASAHNPLSNVDMETIIPQMPFIITAYKELAERL